MLVPTHSVPPPNTSLATMDDHPVPNQEEVIHPVPIQVRGPDDDYALDLIYGMCCCSC